MINIANLLRNAKKGTILWSPLFGPVEFMQLGKNDQIWVRVDNSEPFDKYGRYFGSRFPEAECQLFPSNKIRTWVGWTPSIEPKFKVGDWITDGACKVKITDINNTHYWYSKNCILGEIESIDKKYHLWTIQDAKDGDVLAINWHEDNDSWEKIVIFKKYHIKGINGLFNTPCVEGYGNTFKNGKLALQEEVPYFSKTWTTTLRPATQEQRDLLFAKMREEGYEWDADKKELKKIPKHYDIANFHAGMPVLVRDADNSEWKYVAFSHYREDGTFCACGSYWYQCIPLDGNETLLGTTDMCNERFVNW